MTVSIILQRKAFQAAVVAPTDRIADVAEVLAERHTDAALVLDRARQLLGIISDRDIVESLAANGPRTLEMTAGQLMTKPRRHVTPPTSIASAMRVMLAGPLNHLPVFDEAGELLGLIGLADVARASIAKEEGMLAA